MSLYIQWQAQVQYRHLWKPTPNSFNDWIHTWNTEREKRKYRAKHRSRVSIISVSNTRGMALYPKPWRNLRDDVGRGGRSGSGRGSWWRGDCWSYASLVLGTFNRVLDGATTMDEVCVTCKWVNFSLSSDQPPAWVGAGTEVESDIPGSSLCKVVVNRGELRAKRDFEHELRDFNFGFRYNSKECKLSMITSMSDIGCTYTPQESECSHTYHMGSYNELFPFLPWYKSHKQASWHPHDHLYSDTDITNMGLKASFKKHLIDWETRVLWNSYISSVYFPLTLLGLMWLKLAKATLKSQLKPIGSPVAHPWKSATVASTSYR